MLSSRLACFITLVERYGHTSIVRWHSGFCYTKRERMCRRTNTKFFFFFLASCHIRDRPHPASHIISKASSRTRLPRDNPRNLLHMALKLITKIVFHLDHERGEARVRRSLGSRPLNPPVTCADPPRHANALQRINRTDQHPNTISVLL